MLPFALTLAVAVTGYVIHSLQQRAYNGPGLNPQAVTNCLRYTDTTHNYGQVWFNRIEAYIDPILNKQNIAAFIGTTGQDCDLFLETMREAYQSGPWAKNIFRITLGTNHQLKVTISEEIRRRYHIVGGSLPYVNTIILESLRNTATDKYKNLWEPAHVLRHEMIHAFIKLFNEKNNHPQSKPQFINNALKAFNQSLSKIEKLRADSYSFQEIELVKDRARLIKNQLQVYPDPKIQAIEIITHLMQFIPEPLIKKYFPFFATQIESMITSFDNAELSPHPEALDDDKWYTPSYAIDQQNYLTFRDIDLAQPYALMQQAMKAIQENDRRTIEYFIDFFEHSDTKTRINGLKNNNERAYVDCHLLAAKCYDFMGQHKPAYQHYSTAWEIDHSKKISTHQFNGEQVQRMFQLKEMLEKNDISMKPLSNSMKRAAKRF